MKFTLCTPRDDHVYGAIEAAVKKDPDVLSVEYVGHTSYRRSTVADLDLFEVETDGRVQDVVESVVGRLRNEGYRVWRYIPRAGNRKHPAAQPRLNLTEQEMVRATIAAAIDGIRPTGRSAGFPELVTYFIQLMNDRYEELEAVYGAEYLENVDPRDLVGA